MSYTYDAKELHRTAKWCCKGLGRYVRWELRVGSEHLSLVVYYKTKTGEIKTTNCAI